MTKENTYHPSKIKFEALKNKIYLLTWQQFGHSKQKLMTKAMALKSANDPNVNAALREAITNAFKRGEIL